MIYKITYVMHRVPPAEFLPFLQVRGGNEDHGLLEEDQHQLQGRHITAVVQHGRQAVQSGFSRMVHHKDLPLKEIVDLLLSFKPCLSHEMIHSASSFKYEIRCGCDFFQGHEARNGTESLALWFRISCSCRSPSGTSRSLAASSGRKKSSSPTAQHPILKKPSFKRPQKALKPLKMPLKLLKSTLNVT